PGAQGPVTITQSWADPVLWDPGEPRLLQLVTEITDEKGNVIDRRDTRFGFREFWPEGRNLVWNGRPVKFGAVPFLTSWGRDLGAHSQHDFIRSYLLAAKRLGVTMFRHIYDPEYRAEIQDEEGIVFAQAGSVPIQPTTQKVESDEYWKNAAAFSAEMIAGL